MSRLRTLIAAIAIAGLQTGSAAAQSSPIWHTGFVIRVADRFDPAIQQLMAEHSLRLLPLERGQLYYVYPIGTTPRLEGVQIRYLEALLDKRSAEEPAAAESDPGEAPGSDR